LLSIILEVFRDKSGTFTSVNVARFVLKFLFSAVHPQRS
jgi:hypothetical protein